MGIRSVGLRLKILTTRSKSMGLGIAVVFGIGAVVGGSLVAARSGGSKPIVVEPANAVGVLPACSTGQLALSSTGGNAAGVWTYGVYAIKNVGTGSCRVQGVPALRLLGPTGTVVTKFVENPASLARTIKASRPVTLAPQGAASFYVGIACVRNVNWALRDQGPFKFEVSLPGIAGHVAQRSTEGIPYPAPETVISSLHAGSTLSIPGFTTGGSPPVSLPGSRLPKKLAHP